MKALITQVIIKSPPQICLRSRSDKGEGCEYHSHIDGPEESAEVVILSQEEPGKLLALHGKKVWIELLEEE